MTGRRSRWFGVAVVVAVVAACGPEDTEHSGTYHDAVRAYEMRRFEETLAILDGLDTVPDDGLLELLAAAATPDARENAGAIEAFAGPVDVGPLDLAVPVRGYDETLWTDEAMMRYLSILERCLGTNEEEVPTGTAMEVRDSLATVLTHPFLDRLSAQTLAYARALSDRSTVVLMERTPLGNYSSEVE